MIKMLQSGWMCAVLGLLVYAGTTLAVYKSPKIEPRAPLAVHEETPAAKPSWEFTNPEADELIDDLRSQKVALAERERQLNELDARLKAERAEINTVLESIKAQQAEFDNVVVRVRQEEVANLKRLAKMYAAMSPEGAVTILKEMKDDDIVRIFIYMKDDETAPIVELLARSGAADAKRAAHISSRLRVTMSRNLTENKQP